MRPILIAGVALASFAASAAGKHHVLKATPESVQWGWLDPSEPPKLTIDSGDTVSIETLLHARDQIQKGVSMEKIVELRKANPGGGPHSNRLQPIVRKDLKLTWPRIETKTHFIQVGFDEDLMKAFTIALNETVDFLTTRKGLDRYEAYSLASIAADCRVSQVVDVRKGVHCMVPKSIFTAAKTATR
jgi:acetamidase/formamidase